MWQSFFYFIGNCVLDGEECEAFFEAPQAALFYLIVPDTHHPAVSKNTFLFQSFLFTKQTP